MEKEKPNKQTKSSNEGYVIVPAYFLNNWVEILGTGPSMLYIQLLNYCYKGKDIAWPTLATLSKKMQFTPKTITKYHQILLKYGLIKKVSKRKTSPGSHMRNIYQLTPLDMGKNTLPIGNIYSYLGEKITPDIGKNLPTNNNNLKHYQGNNNKEGENAVVAANFKKIKEKGDLSACTAQAEEKMQEPHANKEHCKEQAIKEQLRDLDFEGKFIEKILKEYPVEKIEEKLDLLMEKRNIQSPAGWLRAALKNDYRGEEPSLSSLISSLSFPRRRESSECHDESRIDSRFRGNDIKGSGNDIIPNVIASDRRERGNPVNTPEWTSREKALEAINLIKDNLSLPVYPSSPQGKGL